MKSRTAVWIALLLTGGAVVASGDWNPGDPDKSLFAVLCG